MRQSAERSLALVLIALACGQAGCRSLRPCSLPADLPAAREALARSDELAAAGDERCVEAYFQAAHLAWLSLGEPVANCCYREATGGLLCAAQRFGRLDPTRGLTISIGGKSELIPVVQQGFAWRASDFQRLHPPPTGSESLLTRRYGCQGLGAPLVVERCRDDSDALEARFFPERSFFAATAILRFDASAPVLEFHEPAAVRTVQAGECSLPLASDLSAPLALALEESPRSYFAGFIEPGGAATAARLNFLEPYQPGKVPLVLIHGLFSDPLSWADLVNDLRATPGFAERFQIWAYRYPTGQGFLRSAATLRTELQAAIDSLDPQRGDAALRQMVLIGHSMGGLIAKLQVTHSDEFIWSRLSRRPLEELVTTEEARAMLAETCYFEPSPHVARVIFIAVPHAGSLRSSGLVGRGASLLVEPSAELAAMHDQLVRDNPGAFYPEFEERLPTSIDMLAPQSPLLEAMRQMRLGCGVKLHNILGVSHPISLDGPSDGIVSVRSASHPGCQSILAIAAPHARVHRSLETSCEILRILSAAEITTGSGD